MTAPRWSEEREPITLEVDALPITLVMLSPPGQREQRGRHVYVEMIAPSGLRYLVIDRSIERSHDGRDYTAACMFDAYGSWYVTWHGLEDNSGQEAATVAVIVVPPEAC